MIGHIDIGTEELFLKLGYRLNSHTPICMKSSYIIGWFLARWTLNHGKPTLNCII
jgi:hypothetical protein